MSSSLIIYSTVDGHTKSICEHIKNNFKSDANIKIVSLDDMQDLNLSNFDKIIIGASIRYGRHRKKVLDFVKKNIDVLHFKKSAFFSVNVVARKLEKSKAETNPYVIKFLKKTKWKPDKVDVFAGKVDYPNYNFINKIIIKLIMRITNGPTDTNNSYEFTDWQRVERFAQEVKDL